MEERKQGVSVFVNEFEGKFILVISVGEECYLCDFDTFEEADIEAKKTAEALQEFFLYEENIEQWQMEELKAILDESIEMRKRKGE